jgi:hypothetical protein
MIAVVEPSPRLEHWPVPWAVIGMTTTVAAVPSARRTVVPSHPSVAPRDRSTVTSTPGYSVSYVAPASPVDSDAPAGVVPRQTDPSQ